MPANSCHGPCLYATALLRHTASQPWGSPRACRGNRLGRAACTSNGIELRSGFPASIRRSIRTREHDRVAIQIAQPGFPVIRTTVSIGRIAVARHDDLRLQRRRWRVSANGGTAEHLVRIERETLLAGRSHALRTKGPPVDVVSFSGKKYTGGSQPIAYFEETGVVTPSCSSIASESKYSRSR